MSAVTVGCDYYGWLATFTTGDPSPWVETLNAAQIAVLLVSDGDTFDLGLMQITRDDLIEARDLLDARSQKLADHKAELSMGEH